MEKIVLNLVKIANFFDSRNKTKEASISDDMASFFVGIMKSNEVWTKIASTETKTKLQIKRAETISGILKNLKILEKTAKRETEETNIPAITKMFRSTEINILKYILSNDLYKNVKIAGVWDVVKNVGKSTLEVLFSPFIPAFQKATYNEAVRALTKVRTEAEQVLDITRDNQEQSQGAIKSLFEHLKTVHDKFLQMAAKASADQDKLNFVITNAAIDSFRGLSNRLRNNVNPADALEGFVYTIEEVIRSGSQFGQDFAQGRDPSQNVSNVSGQPTQPTKREDVAGYNGRPPHPKSQKAPMVIPEFDQIDWNKVMKSSYVTGRNLAIALQKNPAEAKKIALELGIPLDWQNQGRNKYPQDTQNPGQRQIDFGSRLKDFIRREGKEGWKKLYSLFHMNPFGSSYLQGRADVGDSPTGKNKKPASESSAEHLNKARDYLHEW
jgi:hypothetical protein